MSQMCLNKENFEKKPSLDNAEFRTNLCNYMEQYKKDSKIESKEEKKIMLKDKYADKTNGIIEEGNEDEITELNENIVRLKKISNNYKQDDRSRYDNIV